MAPAFMRLLVYWKRLAKNKETDQPVNNFSLYDMYYEGKDQVGVKRE